MMPCAQCDAFASWRCSSLSIHVCSRFSLCSHLDCAATDSGKRVIGQLLTIPDGAYDDVLKDVSGIDQC